MNLLCRAVSEMQRTDMGTHREGQREEEAGVTERAALTYAATMCEIASQWEASAVSRRAQPVALR